MNGPARTPGTQRDECGRNNLRSHVQPNRISSFTEIPSVLHFRYEAGERKTVLHVFTGHSGRAEGEHQNEHHQRPLVA